MGETNACEDVLATYGCVALWLKLVIPDGDESALVSLFDAAETLIGCPAAEFAESKKRAVYEHHPRPNQLIGENDLPQKLQNFIEDSRDGQRAEFWWPSFGEADGHFFDYISSVL
ncbi:unnamed protein product [Ilex paraguariensis]|uniref:Uncharacterized protein n=1 Tax=Ilex paraguariensis TaxID=185542 RepID=A0ABC8QVT4_9AQUA